MEMGEMHKNSSHFLYYSGELLLFVGFVECIAENWITFIEHGKYVIISPMYR